MVARENERSLSEVARDALPRWGIRTDADLRLLSLSENGMFLVSSGVDRWVMRVHRQGYHTENGVRSELAWMDALRQDAGVETPHAVPANDGAVLQRVAAPGGGAPRMVVLFDFISGAEPEPDNLQDAFHHLGAIAARMHRHARRWQRPAWFERQVWDYASWATFLETRDDIGSIVDSWIEGYLTEGQLSPEEIAEIPTFMMFRRLVVMGWAGSHPDTDLAREMGDEYTSGTVELARRYLAKYAP